MTTLDLETRVSRLEAMRSKLSWLSHEAAVERAEKAGARITELERENAWLIECNGRASVRAERAEDNEQTSLRLRDQAQADAAKFLDRADDLERKYDALLLTWGESRERHLKAEAALAELRGRVAGQRQRRTELAVNLVDQGMLVEGEDYDEDTRSRIRAAVDLAVLAVCDALLSPEGEAKGGIDMTLTEDDAADLQEGRDYRELMEAKKRAARDADPVPAPDAQEPERSALLDALETADSWLMLHARHIGSCVGKSLCTCGLEAVRAETGSVLAAARSAGITQGGSDV